MPPKRWPKSSHGSDARMAHRDVVDPGRKTRPRRLVVVPAKGQAVEERRNLRRLVVPRPVLEFHLGDLLAVDPEAVGLGVAVEEPLDQGPVAREFVLVRTARREL